MGSKMKKKDNFFSKDRVFTLTIKLPTGEKFPIKNITPDMKISELKSMIEFAAGIPYHMQRLNYLDEGDLLDSSDIRSNDIVQGGTIVLKVWHTWKELVEAAATNDVDWTMKLGVSKEFDYRTPNSEYMPARSKVAWMAERAFVALFISSHRGHNRLCDRLIKAGADVNAKTPLGRTALHVAAAQGHGKIVDLLLEKGANIDAADHDGSTALQTAVKFGHKGCERHLFLFRWQQRAKQTEKSREIGLMAHQFYDSKFPVWLEGTQGQIYYTQILPPGEYEGSSFHAPKRRPRSAPKERENRNTDPDKVMVAENVQVDLGHETLLHALDVEAEANKHKTYLKSLANKKPSKTRASPKLTAIEERSISSAATSGKRSQHPKLGQGDEPELYGSPVDKDGLPRETRSGKAAERTASGNVRAGSGILRGGSGATKSGRSTSSGKKKSYAFSKTEQEEKPKERPKSYEEWLEVKKEEDLRRIEELKLMDEEKRLEEEAKAREHLAREGSYENWLKEKEKQDKTEKVNKKKKRMNWDKEIAEIQNTYKTKDKERSRTSYDDWLLNKELELLEKVKQGKV